MHEALEQISGLAGPGSQAARAAAADALMRRATVAEQEWLRAVLTGQVRQGALDAVLQEAVAQASGIPVTLVRRAAMLSGSTVEVATVALREGADALDPDRADGRTPGPADARLQRPRGGRGDGQGRARPGRGDRHQAGRDPDPGPPAGVTTYGSGPGRWTRSPPGCPRWSRRSGSLAADDLVLDGEALLLGPRRSATGLPGDRLPGRDGRRRPAGDAVLLRRPARRRPRPARLPRRPALAGARRPRCPSGTWRPAWSPTPRRRPPPSSPRHSRPGTRGWWSRTRRPPTPQVGAAPRGSR